VGIETEFIKSGGRVFEVVADGKLIFSKKKEYRFPEDQEIIEKLRNL
jgi:selT/selW/selH-like putative selenoprotein